MIIELHGITKTFQICKRGAGLKEAIKSLFKKEYSYVKALDDISFRINRGEIVGYIGPNGAGKSTSIKIMCGILTPDSGECTINGLVPWKNRINNSKQIGVVFGQRTQLWWDIPVADSFILLKEIYEIPDPIYERNLNELDSILHIKSLLTVPLRQLSLGQRMQCEFAAALLHSPEILFLDEPTIGLDAVSKRAIRELIKEVNIRRKVTVLLTTHDMQDIETLATRIILLWKGKLIFNGTPEQFKKKTLGDKVIRIKHADHALPKRRGLTIRRISESETLVTFNSSKVSVSEVLSYINKNLAVRDIVISEASIEDTVLHLYEKLKI